MKSFPLKIATPERVVFENSVAELVVPTIDGEITVLPKHIPIVAALSAGELIISDDEAKECIPLAVAGGVLQVTDDEVVVLADFAEHIDELSDERLEEAKRIAEEETKDKGSMTEEELREYERKVERAITHVKLAGKWKDKKYRKLPKLN